MSIAQLYRDRADSENGFDELKNQWGWGGYVTQDLKRCRFMAKIVALIYNWWNIFARLLLQTSIWKQLSKFKVWSLILSKVLTAFLHGRTLGAKLITCDAT